MRALELGGVEQQQRDGSFVGRYALVIGGVDHRATVEAIACREALALPEDLHIQHFVISSSSNQVIGDISTTLLVGATELSLVRLLLDHVYSIACLFLNVINGVLD